MAGSVRSFPISRTFAVFNIASAASIAATRPLVSTMPKAKSIIVHVLLLMSQKQSHFILRPGVSEELIRRRCAALESHAPKPTRRLAALLLLQHQLLPSLLPHRPGPLP